LRQFLLSLEDVLPANNIEATKSALMEMYTSLQLFAIASNELPAGALQERLPPEILREIFLCCNPWDDPVIEIPVHRTRGFHTQTPWCLGQVCSAWRQVILSEPRFWHRIKFNSVGSFHKDMLTTVIHRSGTQRLDLDITLDSSPGASQLGEVLSRRGDCIDKLSMEINEPSTRKILCLLPGLLPMTSLTELQLTYSFSNAATLYIMKLSPCLTTCRLDGMFSALNEIESLEDPHTTLPSLTTLYSKDYDYRAMNELIGYLTPIASKIHICIRRERDKLG
jgi:hypothetical protein